MRLQQVINRGGADGSVIHSQRLHHFLRARVKAVEGFAHQFLHHFIGQAELEQFFERGVTVNRQDGIQRFQRARVAACLFAGFIQQGIRCGLESHASIRVHFTQDVFRVRRFESFIQTQVMLPAWLADRQVTRRDACGDDRFHGMVLSAEQGVQRVAQFAITQAQAFGVDQGFKVIQQQDHTPAGEGIQQRAHFIARGCLRVLIDSLQPLGVISRQEFAQVREDVRKVDPVTARLAQIDDPVNFHLAEVIGKLASFQRLEQAANHCSFSHPRATHNRHQAL